MGPQSVSQMDLPTPVIKGNLPSIKLASHVEERGLMYCKFALVGRLDLNLMKTDKVRELAQKVWKPTGDCKTVPLGRGYLMFRFDSQADFDRVINVSSWSFGNQTLRLHKWSPSFDPESMSNSHANVWIKFTRLKQHYWDKEALFSMANAIGKPIGLDKNTSKRNFGYFASVMVEVDMSKHLPEKIVVELNNGVEFIQEVQYSGLPKFCNFCTMVGHISNECSKFQALKEVARFDENSNPTVAVVSTPRGGDNTLVNPEGAGRRPSVVNDFTNLPHARIGEFAENGVDRDSLPATLSALPKKVGLNNTSSGDLNQPSGSQTTVTLGYATVTPPTSSDDAPIATAALSFPATNFLAPIVNGVRAGISGEPTATLANGVMSTRLHSDGNCGSSAEAAAAPRPFLDVIIQALQAIDVSTATQLPSTAVTIPASGTTRHVEAPLAPTTPQAENIEASNATEPTSGLLFSRTHSDVNGCSAVATTATRPSLAVTPPAVQTVITNALQFISTAEIFMADVNNKAGLGVGGSSIAVALPDGNGESFSVGAHVSGSADVNTKRGKGDEGGAIPKSTADVRGLVEPAHDFNLIFDMGVGTNETRHAATFLDAQVENSVAPWDVGYVNLNNVVPYAGTSTSATDNIINVAQSDGYVVYPNNVLGVLVDTAYGVMDKRSGPGDHENIHLRVLVDNKVRESYPLSLDSRVANVRKDPTYTRPFSYCLDSSA